jgi:hypothetical protein
MEEGDAVIDAIEERVGESESEIERLSPTGPALPRMG